MNRFVRSAFVCASLLTATPAFAQSPPADAAWSYPQLRTAQSTTPVPAPTTIPSGEFVPEPEGPIATGLPIRRVLVRDLPLQSGQQHWVSANLGVGQPSTGRVAVKLWSRPQNSLWVEAFAGSAILNTMYGFGVRMQHTTVTFRNGDTLMVSPGAGVHILPNWYAYDYRYGGWGWGWDSGPAECRNTLCFVYGDVDISWLHDFNPHFGFELGMKLGFTGLVSGKVGKSYPRDLMAGPDAYPIVGIYSGFRF